MNKNTLQQKYRHYLYILLFLCILVLNGPSLAFPLSDKEQRIIDHVDAQFENSIAFLEKVVNINSGTMNHTGVREVGSVFEPEFKALGFQTSWIDVPPEVDRAGHLFAETNGSLGKRLLLIGHLDTVFEQDSPFQKFVRYDSTASGPGVNDMKGGDVAILYALKALDSVVGLKNTRIIVAFMGDEEKPGLPTALSRKALVDAGEKSEIALGFETMIPGTATIARRGISGWRLSVEGKEAHSSGVFSKDVGSGAIFEAARILNAFHQQIKGEEYLTFNPGIILGGTQTQYDAANTRGSAFGKLNVVANTVTVEGDLRFISEEQKIRTREKMQFIAGSANLPETSARIEFSDSNPAMPPTAGNRRLLEIYDEASRDLGFGEVKPFDPGGRGAADIAFVAADVDGLDGLGVDGEGAHSLKESIDLNSMLIATKRAALMIYRLIR